MSTLSYILVMFVQAEDGIRDLTVTGVQTCALPISCGERLQKVVRPALLRFLTELENAGHDASVQDHTDSVDTYPSVALSFTPRASGARALASLLTFRYDPRRGDRKSTRLNSSHSQISYAV